MLDIDKLGLDKDVKDFLKHFASTVSSGKLEFDFVKLDKVDNYSKRNDGKDMTRIDIHIQGYTAKKLEDDRNGTYKLFKGMKKYLNHTVPNDTISSSSKKRYEIDAFVEFLELLEEKNVSFADVMRYSEEVINFDMIETIDVLEDLPF